MCESFGQFLATRPRAYVDCDPPGDGEDAPKGQSAPELENLEIRDTSGEIVDPVRILSGLNTRG